MPQNLLSQLKAFADSGEATRLYDRFHRSTDRRRGIPDHPLLYVPSHASRDLGIDLEAAGIPKHGPGGKLDFHACRTAYVNLVLDSGATVKEAQELARHSTPDLTMNVYGRTREDRLTQAVEHISDAISEEAIRAPSVHKLAVGEEQRSTTPLETKDCASSTMVEAASTTLPEASAPIPSPVPLQVPLQTHCLALVWVSLG
jgi:hypothetical protein